MPKNYQLTVMAGLKKALDEQGKLTGALEKAKKAKDAKKAEKIKKQIDYADQIIDGLNKQLKTAYTKDKKYINDLFNL